MQYIFFICTPTNWLIIFNFTKQLNSNLRIMLDTKVYLELYLQFQSEFDLELRSELWIKLNSELGSELWSEINQIIDNG